VIDVLTSTPVAQSRPERALAYLEKIVQVRLDLPPVQRFYTEQMLGDGITTLLGRLGMAMTDEQASRFRELYDTLLQFTLSQPRAVGRFLSQAVAYLPMTEPGELDVVDFLALTHLRSLAPTAYHVLARSKEPLTQQPGNAAGESPAAVRELLDKRVRAECGDVSEQVLAVLTELFPAVDDEYLTRLGVTDWQQRAAARRASVEEYFDRYFLFGLPVGDIADSTARDALIAIARSEPAPALTDVEARITGPDPDAASRVIRKLTRFSVSADVIDAADLGEVVRYALSLPARASSSPGSLLGSAEHQGMTWATELIERIGKSGLQMDPGLAADLDDMAFSRLCHALRQVVLSPSRHGQALLNTYDQVAEQTCTRIRTHLRQGDGADRELAVGPLVQFVNRSTARSEFARALAADLDAGEFTLADLASRFVAVGRLWDGRHELIGFDDEALISLMGLSNLWNLYTASHLDDTAGGAIDKSDATWAGRRRAGVAELADAIRRQHAVPPRPPSGTRSSAEYNPGQQTGPRNWASRMPPASPAGDAKALVCIRAAVLLPGIAQGLPNRSGSVSVFEETRARALAEILRQVPLTAWYQDKARAHDLEVRSSWEEEGFGSRTYAEFALKVLGPGTQQPLEGHCAVTTGSSQAGDQDVLGLALDLLLQVPRTSEESGDGPATKDVRLSIAQLTEITEVVTRSAIEAARKAAAGLLGASPEDGHLTLWLDATVPLYQVFDLDAFPVVGNQPGRADADVSARLPLEPGQAYDSAHFTTSLRGMAVELLHELLRSSDRRNYTEALHALRDTN